MPCRLIKSKDGTIVGIACSRRSSQRCHICGKPMTALCDATKKDGSPCDVPMCDEHRNSVGKDVDVCKYHNSPKYIEQAIRNRENRADAEERLFEYAKTILDDESEA